ncbi:MAG: hypothetical protein HWQ41_08180 [Nostoc sp. NOS(2021)]|uniref:hypothetical protein n=1 Tax=Nostoc sp. NOS(2021) TaxID=2815407 RepID=UPI0025F64653|nr:hypothetical protein [Nostoc sp. NOS(2021)]MBN3895233.1 hypothetical protein [Nostoc sp. NOS(2021)]
MNLDERHLEATRKNFEAGMDRPLPTTLPPHKTVEPHIYPSTSYIAALDGTDQQMFFLPYSPDQGIAAWGVLYVELDTQHPHEEPYRDGPSGGFLITEDLFYYHLTMDLPNREESRRFRNDFYAIRQTLSSARPTEPPLLNPKFNNKKGVRTLAAVERATGEWLSLRAAITHQLAPGSLVLKDGRFNCQIEQAASWVDELGRTSVRNDVRCVAVVKSGSVYSALFPIVREIAKKTDRAFYFLIPSEIIEESYANDKYKRKTLMLGGKDHTDLAGIGALWTAFCPDPKNFTTFVILEFNLYDLHHYKRLAYEPQSLRKWQKDILKAKVDESDLTNTIHVTDLVIDDKDIERLVEPTIRELLWLCEQEVSHFGYPNLLGIAHKEVILTSEKINIIRQKYREAFANSNELLNELFDNTLDITAHKLHNIY